MKVISIVTVVFLLFCSNVFAFEFQIETPGLMTASTPGHETLTSRAIECLENDTGSMPENCSKSIVIGNLDNTYVVDFPSVSGGVTAQQLLDASSWPDDPTRVSVIKGWDYLKGVKGKTASDNKCIYRNPWTLGLTINDQTQNIEGGLFCNSHYGVLQFWHAMASKPMNFEGYDVEPFDVTLKKVLAWAKFTYSIAQDDQHEILNKSYCAYMQGLKNDPEMEAMARAFLPDASALKDSEQFHCENQEKIDFIFKKTCTNILSSGKCKSINSQKDLQITALGALIHLVQDSYSQSHVARGDCSNGVPNTINTEIKCLPIEQFRDYSKQDSDLHAVTDILPIALHSSCKNGEMDDAITATAKTFWYLKNGKSADDYISYLKSKVLKVASSDVAYPDADGGICYSKS